MSDLDVKKWTDEGDISKLELLVLQGKSHLLEGELLVLQGKSHLLEGKIDQSEATKSFVEKVPHMKEEIKVLDVANNHCFNN